MLKKLMKYEWKAVWKILIIINAFTVFATLLGTFAMQYLCSPDFIVLDNSQSVLALILFAFYYITIISVSVAMTIYIAVRFYRNLYTDEGYLMHTLPVTKRQLVLSKLLVHCLCMLVTETLLLCSLAVLFLPLLSALVNDPNVSFSFASLIDELKIQALISGTSLSVTLLLWIVATIIGQLGGIMAIYCAIALGQTFRQHKVMGSILCYVGIYCFLQTINSILLMPQMMITMNSRNGESFNMISYFNNCILTGSIVSLFTGIVFYIITLHMMDKKLNLD